MENRNKYINKGNDLKSTAITENILKICVIRVFLRLTSEALPKQEGLTCQ
jgi:hypothetical protein